jgi:hypothetical protein
MLEHLEASSIRSCNTSLIAKLLEREKKWGRYHKKSWHFIIESQECYASHTECTAFCQPYTATLAEEGYTKV